MTRTRIGDTMMLLVIAGLVSIPVILTSGGNLIVLGITEAVIGTIVVVEIVFICVRIVEERRRRLSI